MPAQFALSTEPAASVFASTHAHATEVEGILRSNDMIRKPHSDIEESLDEKGREWARQMFDAHLELRATAERRTEVVGADSVDRTQTRASERQLATVLGEVTVRAWRTRPPEAPDFTRWMRP
ncbi:MAG: hypothetical protein JW751_14975 [Polyangiaceae bacterium]|nr:hypothetical protein [Polyangiaceae bacterium]